MQGIVLLWVKVRTMLHCNILGITASVHLGMSYQEMCDGKVFTSKAKLKCKPQFLFYGIFPIYQINSSTKALSVFLLVWHIDMTAELGTVQKRSQE